MPRLSRMRLVCVGHPQARMNDVILPFCDRAGLASNSTIWLRNAGGKSSLVALFLSLVQPGKNQFLGKKADTPRRVEDYVEAKDRSVVVCEWELDEPQGTLALNGSRRHLLTGVFYEWKQQTATEHDELEHLFFAAEVHPDEPRLTLESLPLFVEQDGRKSRRKLANFKQEWLSLRDRYPSQSVVAEETFQRWLQFLGAAHIDPELFKFQVQMNRREGAADEVFRFAEHEDFVDFLLDIAADPSFAEKCSDVLKQYQKDLRERTERLLPERDLLIGLLTRLEPMTHIATERARLGGEAERSAVSFYRQVAFLEQRLAFHRDEAIRLNGVAESHAAAATVAERHAAEHQKSAVRARLIAAGLRHQRAQANEKTCRENHEQSLSVERLTTAAVPLRNAIREERQAKQCREELDRQRFEHGPLLQELRIAADNCAGRLKGAAEHWRQKQREASIAEESARRDAQQLRSDAGRLGADASAARERCGALSRRLVEVQTEQDQLVQGGVLEDSESGSVALERLANNLVTLRDEQRRLEREIHASDASLAQMRTEQSEEDRAAAAMATNLGHLQKRYDEALEERRRLEAETVLRTLLEVEQIDLEQMADTPLQALARESFSAEERLLASRMRQAEEERAVHFLEAKGLLPPLPEVERLLDILSPRFPQLWTGWAWIEKNRPYGAARRATLQRFPHLATGLVVRDQDYETVCQAMRELKDAVRFPVVIAPQRTFDGSGPNDWLVIGPSSEAYFDQQAAIAEKEQLKDHLEELYADIRASTNHRQHVEELATRLRSFRERFSQGWFAERQQVLAVECVRLQRHQDRVRELSRDLEVTGVRRAELQAEHDGCRNRIAKCEQHTQRIEDFIRRLESQQPAWKRERDETLAKVGLLDEQQASALRESAAREQAAEKHSRDARLAVEEAAKYESAVKEMRHTSDAYPTNTTAPLDELRAKYEQLKSQYESQVDEGGLRRLAIEAEGRGKREREKLAAELRRLEEASRRSVTEANVMERLNEVPDWESLEQELAAAKERVYADLGHLRGASGETNRQQERFKEIESQWQTLAPGIQPAFDDDPTWAPDEWESFAKRETESADESDKHGQQSHLEAKQSEDESKQHRHRLDKLEVFRELLNRISAQFGDWLPSAAATAAAPDDDELLAIDLTEEALPGQVKQLDEELRKLREQQIGLDKQRGDAAVEIRKWISDERFQALRTAYVSRFQMLGDEDWETDAADWVRDLTLRLQTIEGKLAEYDQHRTLIVEELSHVVEDGLDLLRSAGTRSRMPEHVPHFGGSQILKINHHAPPDAGERRDRLGTLVDQLVAREELPRGMELFQAVIKHVARPIRVQLRNPDPHAKEPYLEVTRLAVLSGGERITCAILMYCTLAQLRGRARRRDARRPSSVLILDNPIGTANRTMFLELQRDVAQSMDIQLVYTTGVNDWEAVRVLPNVIRLRNDRLDRKSGQRLLEMDSGEPMMQAVHIVRPVEDFDKLQDPESESIHEAERDHARP